ncbi:MAG: hypothetical protein PUJ19_00625 [Campylobacteraceae bacterium]|nr:hypothetical protein [Campylobacteraceae bacterium]MDY4121711.1 hypothetical protein [Campylobacter sp.]
MKIQLGILEFLLARILKLEFPKSKIHKILEFLNLEFLIKIQLRILEFLN